MQPNFCQHRTGGFYFGYSPPNHHMMDVRLGPGGPAQHYGRLPHRHVSPPPQVIGSPSVAVSMIPLSPSSHVSSGASQSPVLSSGRDDTPPFGARRSSGSAYSRPEQEHRAASLPIHYDRSSGLHKTGVPSATPPQLVPLAQTRSFTPPRSQTPSPRPPTDTATILAGPPPAKSNPPIIEEYSAGTPPGLEAMLLRQRRAQTPPPPPVFYKPEDDLQTPSPSLVPQQPTTTFVDTFTQRQFAGSITHTSVSLSESYIPPAGSNQFTLLTPVNLEEQFVAPPARGGPDPPTTKLPAMSTSGHGHVYNHVHTDRYEDMQQPNVADLQQQVLELREKLSHERDYRQHQDVDIRATREKERELQSQLAEADAREHDLAEKAAHLAHQNDILRSRLNEQERMQHERDRTYEAEYVRQQEALANAQDDLNNAKQDLEATRLEELELAQLEVQHLKAELHGNAKYRTLYNEKQTLINEKEALLKERAELLSRMDTRKTDESNQIATLKEMVASLTAQVVSTGSSKEIVELKLKKSNDMIEYLKDELNAMKANANQNALRGQIEALTQQVLTEKNTVKLQQLVIDTHKRQLDELEHQNKELVAKLHKAHTSGILPPVGTQDKEGSPTKILDREQAATTVQAYWRGTSVRKQLAHYGIAPNRNKTRQPQTLPPTSPTIRPEKDGDPRWLRFVEHLPSSSLSVEHSTTYSMLPVMCYDENSTTTHFTDAALQIFMLDTLPSKRHKYFVKQDMQLMWDLMSGLVTGVIHRKADHKDLSKVIAQYKLSDSEFRAVYSFTYEIPNWEGIAKPQLAADLNNAIRLNDKQLLLLYRPYVHWLAKGLNKLPTLSQGYLYRGLKGPSNTEAAMPLTATTAAALLMNNRVSGDTVQSIRQLHTNVIGTNVPVNGFISCSQYNDTIEYNGAVLLIITTNSRMLWNVADNPNEAECLIGLDSQLAVKSIIPLTHLKLLYNNTAPIILLKEGKKAVGTDTSPTSTTTTEGEESLSVLPELVNNKDNVESLFLLIGFNIPYIYNWFRQTYVAPTGWVAVLPTYNAPSKSKDSPHDNIKAALHSSTNSDIFCDSITNTVLSHISSHTGTPTLPTHPAIVVISSNGGRGKTSFSVNLCHTLNNTIASQESQRPIGIMIPMKMVRALQVGRGVQTEAGQFGAAPHTQWKKGSAGAASGSASQIHPILSYICWECQLDIETVLALKTAGRPIVFILDGIEDYCGSYTQNVDKDVLFATMLQQILTENQLHDWTSLSLVITTNYSQHEVPRSVSLVLSRSTSYTTYSTSNIGGTAHVVSIVNNDNNDRTINIPVTSLIMNNVSPQDLFSKRESVHTSKELLTMKSVTSQIPSLSDMVHSSPALSTMCIPIISDVYRLWSGMSFNSKSGKQQQDGTGRINRNRSLYGLQPRIMESEIVQLSLEHNFNTALSHPQNNRKFFIESFWEMSEKLAVYLCQYSVLYAPLNAVLQIPVNNPKTQQEMSISVKDSLLTCISNVVAQFGYPYDSCMAGLIYAQYRDLLVSRCVWRNPMDMLKRVKVTDYPTVLRYINERYTLSSADEQSRFISNLWDIIKEEKGRLGCFNGANVAIPAASAVTLLHHCGVCLAGVDLTRLCFDYSRLNGCVLDGTNLSGSSMRNAQLQCSVLNNCNMTGCDLTGCKLVSTHDTNNANCCGVITVNGSSNNNRPHVAVSSLGLSDTMPYFTASSSDGMVRVYNINHSTGQVSTRCIIEPFSVAPTSSTTAPATVTDDDTDVRSTPHNGGSTNSHCLVSMHGAVLCTAHSLTPDQSSSPTFRSSGGCIKLWDIGHNGLLLRELRCNVDIRYSNWSSDGSMLLAGGYEGIVVFNLLSSNTECIINTIQPDCELECAVFSSDNKEIIGGGDDGTLYIWDINTAELVQQLAPNVSSDQQSTPGNASNSSITIGRILCIELNTSDVGKVFTGSDDGTILMWNTFNGYCREITKLENASIHSLCFNGNIGTHGVILSNTSSADSSVKMWDLATGYLVETYSGHQGIVNRICCNNNGDIMLTCSSDSTVRLWNLQFDTNPQPKRIRGGPTPPTAPNVATSSVISKYGIREDGKVLLRYYYDYTANQYFVTLLALNTDACLQKFPIVKHSSAYSPPATNPTAIAWSRDLSVMILGGDVWSLQTGTFICSIAQLRTDSLLLASALYCSPASAEPVDESGNEDSTEQHANVDVLFVAEYVDGSIQLWRRGKDWTQWELVDHVSALYPGMVTSSGGRTTPQNISTPPRASTPVGGVGAGSTVALPTATPYVSPCPAVGGTGSSAASYLGSPSINSTDSTVVTTSDHRDKHPTNSLHHYYKCIVFSEDGNFVATPRGSKNIYIYKLQNKRLVDYCLLKGHTKSISSVQFCNNNNNNSLMLLSGSSDRTVRVWDVNKSKTLHRLRGHNAPVVNISYNVDTNTIISSDTHGVVKVWQNIVPNVNNMASNSSNTSSGTTSTSTSSRDVVGATAGGGGALIHYNTGVLHTSAYYVANVYFNSNILVVSGNNTIKMYSGHGDRLLKRINTSRWTFQHSATMDTCINPLSPSASYNKKPTTHLNPNNCCSSMDLKSKNTVLSKTTSIDEHQKTMLLKLGAAFV